MIIIITFKGANQDFLQSPQCATNRPKHVVWAQSCANHVRHIECLSHATCCVTCHVVQRDSSAVKFDSVAILFISALFYYIELISECLVVPAHSDWCISVYTLPTL